jgi:hypothetical protein
MNEALSRGATNEGRRVSEAVTQTIWCNLVHYQWGVYLAFVLSRAAALGVAASHASVCRNSTLVIGINISDFQTFGGCARSYAGECIVRLSNGCSFPMPRSCEIPGLPIQLLYNSISGYHTFWTLDTLLVRHTALPAR